jgi:rubredoxin
MIKTSKLDQIQLFLENNRGYLKWGKDKLAKKLNCKPGDIIEVRRKIYNGDKVNFIHLPNILILDIETAPLKAFVWRRWKQDIHLDQTISEWYMLTWSAKWLGDDKVMSARLTGEESLKENDERIVKELWDLINDADIVIAHNGDKFDIPKINSRFIINNLPPTSFYQQIDTKKVAAKQFGFSSNKLDALATYFNIPNKIKTDMELWVDCVNGSDEALKKMEIYNIEDVNILEKVYLRLRGYIKNHPNVTLYDDVSDPNRCPTCGSSKKQEEDYYYTTVGQFQVYRCLSCGALYRSRKAVKRGVVTANLSLGR